MSWMKILYYIFLVFLVISCTSNQDLNHKWNNAVKFREESKFMESITLLREIISLDKIDTLTIKAQYQIADIYSNDVNQYVFAIDSFKKLIHNFPNSDYSRKAIFRVAYIYANYLDSYNDAIDYYSLYLEKYPSDELTQSILYELEQLNPINENINILKNQ